jgi:hypothetical protein
MSSGSAKRVTLMFSVNVSRLPECLRHFQTKNAPSKELKTSGFGLTSLSTSLAFGYFLFSTLCNVLLISNNNEFIAHVCWSKKRVHCVAVVYIRRHPGKKYMSLAEDLVTAPASQAFVERIFSVCGLVTAGRRNRMEKLLEMKVFLKLNSHITE